MRLFITPIMVVTTVFLAACAASAEIARDNEVTPHEAYNRQAQGVAVIVDVRTVREYQTAHIDGAVNIPLSDVTARAQELLHLVGEREVILYCRSGRRAGIAETLLRERGVLNILHLNGQLAGWVAEGLPVNQDS